jgi:hypothetical protein
MFTILNLLAYKVTDPTYEIVLLALGAIPVVGLYMLCETYLRHPRR